MRLELVMQADARRIVLHNDSAEVLRVWAFTNSWGWRTISLHLKKANSSAPYVLTQRKNMVWTIDFAEYIALSPHETYTLPLYPGDGRWEADRDLAALKGQPFLVKAVLEIPESPEALEFGVFVGKIESEWVRSDPPHTWLFQVR